MKPVPTSTVAAARPAFSVGAVVLALTLVGAALRFSTLGVQSYWYDELVTVSLLHRSFNGLLNTIPSSEATPYLYYVLAWPWARLFGFGEAGVRSLSALAGTLTIPVTYAAGAALVSRRVGLGAAALVAVNPFLVWYSQEARAYALLALLASATVYSFARAWRGEPRALLGWSVAAAAALATQYFAVFVVAPELILLLVRARRRDVLLAAAAPAAVLAAELPLILDQRGNGANVAASPLSHRVVGIPKDLLVGYGLPAEVAGTAAAALLVLVGVWFALDKTTPFERKAALVAAGIAMFALVVPVVLALGGADYVIARNMIAVIVPAAIFVGSGYAARRSGLVLASVLCACSLAIVASVAADKKYGRTDWRGALHALGDATSRRAIVATPTIDAQLLQPYARGIASPSASTVDVREIDVIALASQGGFSAGAVHPPSTPPRPAPAGFRLLTAKRTATFVLVRYRAPTTRAVTSAQLAALALADTGATIMVQGPSR